MATNTTNYNLVKPDDNESADISVINANMDIIDTGMKNLDNGKEALIKNATEKISMADADTLPLVDSTDSSKTKKLTFANLKALLKTIFATTEDISVLNASLNTEITNRTSAVSNEATARVNADATKLPLTGGTLTGHVTMGGNCIIQFVSTSAKVAQIFHDSASMTLMDYIDGSNYSKLWFNTSMALSDQLRFYNVASGSASVYRIYGEHNITISTVAPSATLAEGCQHQVYA